MPTHSRDRGGATASADTRVMLRVELEGAAVADIKNSATACWAKSGRKAAAETVHLQHVARGAARREELGERRRLSQPTGACGGGGGAAGRHRLHNDGSHSRCIDDRRRAWGLV